MKTRVIHSDNAPKAIGPYSQAIEAGDFVYISGQLPVNPKTGKMSDNLNDQTKQVMSNILAIIKAIDLELGFSNIVKTTIFLKDLEDFKTVNDIYASYFDGSFPARATFEVSKLPLDASLEIESVVYKG